MSKVYVSASRLILANLYKSKRFRGLRVAAAIIYQYILNDFINLINFNAHKNPAYGNMKNTKN